MLDLDARAARAVASPVATPPDLEAIQRRAAQQRRKRNARRAAAAGAVIVALGITGASVARSGSETAPVEAGNGGAPGVAQPITRPVLDLCTPTRAAEGIMTGTGHTDPERDGEVFAVPGQGSDGPTAVLLRMPGDTLSQVPNATVAGRPARVDAEPEGEGGITWIVADGTTAIVFSRALTGPQLVALAEAITAGQTALPGGLASLGPTTEATWARSTCTDEAGFIAAVEVIRGPAADRYARLLAEPAGTHWDEGDTTFLFMERPSANPAPRPVPRPAVRQATTEEWESLLDAGRPTGS